MLFRYLQLDFVDPRHLQGRDQNIEDDGTKCKIAEKSKFTHCYENWRIMCSSLCIKVTDLNFIFYISFVLHNVAETKCSMFMLQML